MTHIKLRILPAKQAIAWVTGTYVMLIAAVWRASRFTPISF